MFTLAGKSPLDYGTLYDSFQNTLKKYPDRPAYKIPAKKGRAYYANGFEISWQQVNVQVQKYLTLYKKSGFRKGNRVAILFNQRPEFFYHFLALNSLGVSVVPINPDYKTPEIAYLLEHSEPKLVVSLSDRLDEIRNIDFVRRSNLPCISLDFFDGSIPEMPVSEFERGQVDAKTEAVILYTSGTTGRPKGCILTNEYFHTFATCYLSSGGLLNLNDPNEALYNPLPLHHANCLSICVPTLLLTGGCLVFPERFHASTWWQDILDCEVTVVHMQGIVPNILLKLPVNKIERSHKVKFGLCAGIEPNQHEIFEKRFSFPVVEMWSMTEAGRFITDNFEPRKIRTRAFGRSVPGIEAKVCGPQNQFLGPNTPGELVIRNNATEPRKGFFSGYLKDSNATEEAWAAGWFHTGDTVYFDDDGMFYFMDRMKNIIRRAGENIAAAEIETCITKHDKVKQVAVIAVEDEIREEDVMACIVLQGRYQGSEEIALEIFEWSKEYLAYFKLPAWILFVDNLPIGTSQKVQKVNLFPKGLDPRKEPNVIDMRSLKKKGVNT